MLSYSTQQFTNMASAVADAYIPHLSAENDFCRQTAHAHLVAAFLEKLSKHIMWIFPSWDISHMLSQRMAQTIHCQKLTTATFCLAKGHAFFKSPESQRRTLVWDLAEHLETTRTQTEETCHA